MKTLIKLFPQFKIVVINYKGEKRKGYDIIDNDNNILVSLEPKNYSNLKWFVAIKGLRYFHAKNIIEAAKNILEANIKAGKTGWIFRP